MKKRHRILLAIAVFAVLGGIALAALSAREPAYQGRRLSAWLGDFNVETPEVRQKAREAVRHIGTNGLPLVVEFLGSKDSPLKLRVMGWAKRQSLVQFHFTLAQDRRRMALNACDALGSSARPAIP